MLLDPLDSADDALFSQGLDDADNADNADAERGAISAPKSREFARAVIGLSTARPLLITCGIA